MNTLVLDSSVIVKLLNDTDEKNIEEADKILAAAIEGEIELIAPELAKYEIGNVLLLKKKLTPEEVNIALRALYSYPIQFIVESENLANDTFNMAFNSGITYYDAAFLSLAKQLNATLVTENIKHQGKATNIKVISLSDYSAASI